MNTTNESECPTAYLIVAEFDYGIDYWYGNVSEDPDTLMEYWERYLNDMSAYYPPEKLPKFIRFHKVTLEPPTD